VEDATKCVGSKKVLPKTAEAVEEKEKKKMETAMESARRKADDDEVMKFMCRHAVGDKVTRPPWRSLAKLVISEVIPHSPSS
jgi:hypothetical protein